MLTQELRKVLAIKVKDLRLLHGVGALQEAPLFVPCHPAIGRGPGSCSWEPILTCQKSTEQ